MTLRVARHTNCLKPIIKFYTNVLALEVLGEFVNHDKYEGVFLGKSGIGWYLEFTTSDQKADHTFDPDDILVFYPHSLKEYQLILEKINQNNIPLGSPKNPYWVTNGVLIHDPDGYNIIISKQNI